MFLLKKYYYFFVFLLIISIFSILIFSLSKWIAPTNKGPEKFTSYESGIEPMGEACIQFQIRYYMFALVFVIFDVETVFSLSLGYDIRMAKRSIRMVLNFKFFTCENSLEDKSSTMLRNSIESSVLNKTLTNSIILTTFNDFSNWARLSSLWPLLYGTSCCFIEFASLIGSRFDFDRYGLVPRSSPRQADLIITAGTVTMKMAPSLVRLYEQMPEPKYVIAMGACTITGGMFSTDSYTTVRGVDKLIPVDIYLPGCPPKPEAIIDAIIKLRKKKIAQEIYEKKNP
ncbi:hypothetical protein Mapa_018730 [Marchantia paleacea]|nr:hypothetical protein Mapa_018730 [Marchantia paleacea]